MGQLSAKEKENALNEVRILASIQNENIISYKESFFEDSTSSLCIVMEYADGGDLLQKINQCKLERGAISEQEAWSYFLQAARGLQTLHDLKIVHRDIKCANLFLTKDGNLKLGDLNVSKVAAKGMLQTQTGTPYYASPEVWQDRPYDLKSDIWSLGCVLFEMCALNPPFKGADMQQLFRKICEGRVPLLPQIYSKDLNNMVKLCLQQTPRLRPTCADILSKSIKNMPASLKYDNELVQEDQLIGTIKVPRNLAQITDRLPQSNYESQQKRMQRNVSLPSIELPQSGRAEYILNNNLAVIQETRDEVIRSADLRRTRSNHAAANELRYNVRNEPKGYNGQLPVSKSIAQDKENNYKMPPISHRAPSGRQSRDEPQEQSRVLRNNGAAILNSNPTSVRHSLESMKQQEMQRPNYQNSPSQRYVKGNSYQVNPQANVLQQVISQVGQTRPPSLNRLEAQYYNNQAKVVQQTPNYLLPSAGIANRYYRN